MELLKMQKERFFNLEVEIEKSTLEIDIKKRTTLEGGLLFDA